MPASKPSRYVILPARGLQATGEPQGMSFLESLAPRVGAARSGVAAMAGSRNTPPLLVIDSIHENGPKLVEASPEDLPALRAAAPGVRIVPEVFYFPQVVRPSVVEKVK